MTFKAAHSIPVYKSVPKNDCCDQTCLVGHTFHLLLDVTSYIYENLALTQVSIWASGDIYDDLGSQEGHRGRGTLQLLAPWPPAVT